MPNFNKVIIAGHMTRDPEVKYLSSGSAICNFSVAVSEKWKDKTSGEMKESTAFIDCDAWGKTAEIIGQHFSKGKPILVEGRLKQENWDDKETGKKRSKLKVTVDSFQFLGGGKGEGAPSQGDYQKADADVPSDEVPF